MSRNRPTVLVIGPTPPPFTGPAVNTRAIVDAAELRARFRVVHLDTSDRRPISNQGRLDPRNIVLALAHGLGCAARLLVHRPTIVYLPLSPNRIGFLRDLLFMLPALACGARLVLHHRGGRIQRLLADADPILRLLIRFVLARTARVIVLGETFRSDFEPLLPAGRIRVIPNGLDPTPYQDVPPAVLRPRDGAFRITYLGNLIEEKGYADLLAAVPRIVELIPEARFHFAGEFFRPDRAARAEELVRRHRLGAHVDFLGVVRGDDKVKLLRRSDVLVFPSAYRYEGHPMVVLEGMAAGLPVIATHHAAIPETLSNEETGLLVPTGCPGALAAAIVRLHDDEELRRDLGKAARRRFLARYTLARCVRALAETLAEVCAEAYAERRPACSSSLRIQR